jgi:hypothetical protein
VLAVTSIILADQQYLIWALAETLAYQRQVERFTGFQIVIVQTTQTPQQTINTPSAQKVVVLDTLPFLQ